MKKNYKVWLSIAIAAMIGLAFAVTACDNGSTPCTHSWGEWDVTSAATCVADGTGTRTCIDCGEAYPSNVIPKLGHEYEYDSSAVAPTCTTAGQGLRWCKRDGCDFEENTPYDKLGHSFTDGICTRSSCFMIEMANIEGGSFDIDTHTITLSAFKMSKFQVTQGLYEAVMGNNPSWFQGTETDRVVTAGEVQGKRPVERVTWFDAVMFCNKLSEREGLAPFYTITNITTSGNNITAATVVTNPSANGYRLPTEAQWEYACRAGSTTLWHFGDDEAQLVNYAWYSVNSNSRTHQVGLKLPNEFGLYDMHGNVWEWCWDRWGTFPDPDDLTDPEGAPSGVDRVIRGGCWYVSASGAQSAVRSDDWPGSWLNYLGFRFVCP